MNMTALLIILAIVLFFALILSLRIKLYIRQTDELRVRAGVGPILLTLAPKKKKTVKLSDFTYRKHQKRLIADRKKAEKKAAKAAIKAEKKKSAEIQKKLAAAHEKSKGSITDKLSAVLDIVEFVFEELPRLASYLKTEIKMLKISVVGKDAADTAQKYGAVCALTSCLIELLDNKTALKRMNEGSVSVSADFTGEKTKILLDISVKISIFSVLRVGLHTLKWLISQKLKNK